FFPYFITILVAVVILRSSMVHDLLLSVVPFVFFAEFIAGFFYTSIVTVPISVSLLSVLSETSNIYFISLAGGLGAVTGDFLIMRISEKIRRGIKIKKPSWTKKIPRSVLLIL